MSTWNRLLHGGIKGVLRHLVTQSRGNLIIFCLLMCAGCAKEKSTEELLEDLKAPQEKERISAVRTLPRRKGDAAKVVPALVEALHDKKSDVRWSAAIGLGSFGEQAQDAIPALQAAQRDRDPRVREAAGVALSRIDPQRFPISAPQTLRK